jgi:hypothetical protein
MKGRLWIAVLSVLVLLVTTGGLAAAQGTQEKKPQAQAPAAGPSPEEMQAWAAAAAPGEAHKRLASMAGKWTYTMTMWMAPGAPPTTEPGGTIESSMVLGGRYLQSTYKGSVMGQPFEGHGLDGYDNVTKEHFGTWVDNMGTGVMIMKGKCEDPACKVMTSVGEMNDPMAGGPVKVRTVTTHVDKDNFKFEMFMVGGEQDQKTMEINAKRKG